MKLIKKGAEGDIYLTEWNNKKSILKTRKKKEYRNSSLDQRIRKQRTIRESEIISQVKEYGVSSPLIYHINLKNCTIMMQYISGKTVHELSSVQLIAYCKNIGDLVGKMHKNGIMHGDLTTSNFLVAREKLYVIDFGLAQRTTKPEDHAVDLRLFKEILNSAHANEMQKAWKNFLLGYKKIVGNDHFNKVKHLVSVIESRGRYATVV